MVTSHVCSCDSVAYIRIAALTVHSLPSFFSEARADSFCLVLGQAKTSVEQVQTSSNLKGLLLILYWYLLEGNRLAN